MQRFGSLAWRSVVVVVSVSASACAGRTAVWEQEASPKAAPAETTPTDAVAALDKQFDELWATRGDTAKLEAAVRSLADAAQQSPTTERLAKLSRAYYFLADGHYALAERTEEMLATYQKGVEAGEQALVLASPAFAEKMRAGEKAEDAIKVVEANAVPAIYWYSVNLGKWARAEGITKVLFWKDKVRAYLERCLELEPKFFHAAPTRYFGAFYAVAPSYAGGDLDKSEEFFKRSLTDEPNYFATKVLMAENLATKRQDRALFEKLLKEVLEANAQVLPELEPEQLIEKKKAERLLAKADELF